MFINCWELSLAHGKHYISVGDIIVDNGGRAFQAEETAAAKALRREWAFVVEGHNEASMAAAEPAKGNMPGGEVRRAAGAGPAGPCGSRTWAARAPAFLAVKGEATGEFQELP